jgi:hypothetical protein
MYEILEIFGKDARPPETIAETERRFVEVKKRFIVKSCNSETGDWAVIWSPQSVGKLKAEAEGAGM